MDCQIQLCTLFHEKVNGWTKVSSIGRDIKSRNQGRTVALAYNGNAFIVIVEDETTTTELSILHRAPQNRQDPFVHLIHSSERASSPAQLPSHRAD